MQPSYRKPLSKKRRLPKNAGPDTERVISVSYFSIKKKKLKTCFELLFSSIES